MNPRVRKRLNQLIMGLWAFAIVGCLGLSVGCYIDDRRRPRPSSRTRHQHQRSTHHRRLP